jgi:predicted molibdopterin-dependent oxidoreductase YjgC
MTKITQNPTVCFVVSACKSARSPWQIEKVPTTCTYCGTGCTIDLNIVDGRVVKVTGNEEGVANQGSLCVKGRFGYDFIHHADRLTTPLIKENGTFHKASWAEALDLVAQRLGEIKAKHGPDSIAALSSARCTNEENYLMQKFMRAVIGTNNVDHCARL